MADTDTSGELTLLSELTRIYVVVLLAVLEVDGTLNPSQLLSDEAIVRL